MTDYISREERLMILGFLHAIERVKYYDDSPELLDIKRKCFAIMGFEDEDFTKKYSLNIFNGFLDDYFSRGKYKYYPRFKYRDERMYLPAGTLNPRRFERYWSLF